MIGPTKKIVYDNTQQHIFTAQDGTLAAAYIPNTPIDDNLILAELNKVNFTRVFYISRYNQANRTPRLTWAWGRSVLAINNNIHQPIEYRGLEFMAEAMPPWLESLSQFCRETAKMNWGFDPGYNSAIIGKYIDGDDQIAFHTDDEVFLTHHFCANVTIGEPRDFQFKTLNGVQQKQTHEIKLGHKSAFFFFGLEHALPKRAYGGLRYSISFRNMATDVGIGNSFYYCRGLAGAIDNELKQEYELKLKVLQAERQNN